MKHSIIKKIATVAISLFLILVFLLPYLWVVISSLKNEDDIFSDAAPLSWRTFVLIHPTLSHYITLFSERGIAQSLLWSCLAASAQVVLTVIICSTACYALTRCKFIGQKVMFSAVLLTFMLPIEALVIPLYQVVTGLGLQDTITGAFIPWVASPFGIFLLRPFFEEFPKELEDAARLDGAGHIGIFFNIILPSMYRPILMLALLTFQFAWNAFLWPLLIIQSPKHQLIQVAVAQSVVPGELPNWGETFAGTIISSLPIIILFLFLQRYFLRGITPGAMK